VPVVVERFKIIVVDSLKLLVRRLDKTRKQLTLDRPVLLHELNASVNEFVDKVK
jgi:hypothetical protein